VFDQEAKNRVARRQLSWCGEGLDLEEQVVEQFFEFTCRGRNNSKISGRPERYLAVLKMAPKY